MDYAIIPPICNAPRLLCPVASLPLGVVWRRPGGRAAPANDQAATLRDGDVNVLSSLYSGNTAMISVTSIIPTGVPN